MKSITLRKLRLETRSWVLLAPAIAFLAVFFLYPLLYVLSASFPQHSLVLYERLFTTPVYLRVVATTFRSALIVTVICLLLAYPYAYAMTRGGKVIAAGLSVALLLPFWVSLLLRTFSWLILLQDTGLVNALFLKAGITTEPLRLIRNQIGVTIGMTHILLPYAVLPIYAAMRKIDGRLLEAAAICGSGGLRAFFKIYFPLSLPGVLAAGLLTFTLALGFYITPALLGGAHDTMIGQLIAAQVTEQLNFNFAAVLCAVLLAATAITFGIAGIAVAFWRHSTAKRMAAQ